MFNYKLLTGILACFLSAGMYAQHDNHWYFGNEAGLDFSSGTPVAITDGQLNSTEASGVISNANGELLFYTNGISVRNKNHEIMENGTDLLGDVSASQSGLIVPKPGSADTYYIFTAAQFTEADGINYSVVDMGANEGLGAVVEKNVPLFTPACEKLAAVHHANGTDIWVLAHHWGSNAFHAYLISEAGVSETAVISNTGSVLTGNVERSAGYMKFSPDGTKLAVANNNLSFQLFDFDAATGAVGNAVTLLADDTFYGVEFSPSGNALYLAQWGKVSQFDMDADDVAASQITLLELPEGAAGGLQTGPDGKIYLSHFQAGSLTVIHNPDVIGTGCNLAAESLPLGGRLSWWGLPAFLTSPFYITDIVAATQGCGNTIAFSLNTTVEAESAVWNFGDGTVATGLGPVHTYEEAGTYSVRVAATAGNFTRYFTKEITVEAIEVIAIAPMPLLVCDDETGDGQEPFDLTVLDEEILGPQPAEEFTVTYHASFEDADAGLDPLPQPYINTLAAETLFARVTKNGTGCRAVTAFSILVTPLPEINMPSEYTLCAGGTVTLTAPDNFDSYLWSTGETTQSIEVNEEGEYLLTVARDHGSVVCQNIKLVMVSLTEVPVPELDEEYIMCRHFSITIVAPEGYDSYLWSDGTTNRSIDITEKGDYTLTVTADGCEAVREFTVKDILCGIDVPKGISPNNDGLNDALDLAGHDVTSLSIFDRYGQQVYSKVNYESEWHGQADSGHDLPSGTYFYSLQALNRRNQTGWIYINRELD